MRTSPMKLVTLVVPESSQDEIVGALGGAGITGCSILRARGHGAHGPRPTRWNDSQLDWHGPNVQIELVVDEPTVDRVLDVIEQRNEIYGPIVAWVIDASAWPREKFKT